MERRNLVFWAAGLGMLIFGMVMISLGTINTYLTAKCALEATRIGSLAALLPFGILLGSLVFGPIVDRFGYKLLLIVCAGIILLGIELLPLTTHFSVLQLAFFLIGFGGGVINGGTNALVADISAEEKGSRLSFLGVFFGVGALGLPIVVGFLSRFISTGRIIAGIGLTILVPIMLFLVVPFPAPKQKQGFAIGQGLKMLKELPLILIGLVLFCESGLEGVVSNWTTTFLSAGRYNLATKEALYALSFVMIGITATRWLMGFLLKRVRQYLVVYVSIVLIVSALLILANGTTLPAAIVALTLMGIGCAAVFPILYGYAGSLYTAYSGTAFSIILVIALTGNTLQNYTVGLIADRSGIHNFLYLLLGVALMMAVLFSLLIARLKNRIRI